MNSAQEPGHAPSQTSVRMAAVLVVALLLGLAFNSANPLGVRTVASSEQAPVAPPVSRAPGLAASSRDAPRSNASLNSCYDNQTIALSLETDTGLQPVVANAPTLTWAEAKTLLAAGQIVLVDARAAVYYQTEHIPGAVSLPAGSPAQDLAVFTTKYPKDTALVVYCGSVFCPLSNQLVDVLRGQFGYAHVREMPGGFAEYRQFEAELAKGLRK
jgi:rhodanese-related sulfurtransferase